MTMPQVRCAATHDEDLRPCVGTADAVRIIDRTGATCKGCVLHGAVLLKSLLGGRVHEGSEKGAAIAVYYLARELPPYAWRGDLAVERAAELRSRYVSSADRTFSALSGGDR